MQNSIREGIFKRLYPRLRWYGSWFFTWVMFFWKREFRCIWPERLLNPLSPSAPPFLPKVKSVIYLHMVGAPSQLELFDYKPELVKLNNKPCPESLLKGKSLLLSEESQNVRPTGCIF